MSITLPEPISNYFISDKTDSAAVANCFIENAVVKDEGNTYQGKTAIKRWKMDSSKKYSYTSEL
jgi:hypothetical protein